MTNKGTEPQTDAFAQRVACIPEGPYLCIPGQQMPLPLFHTYQHGGMVGQISLSLGLCQNAILQYLKPVLHENVIYA